MIQAINAQKETLDVQASTALEQMKELLRQLEQMSHEADRAISLRLAASRPGDSSQTSDLLSAQNSCESIAPVLKEMANSLGTAVQQAESTVSDLARIRTSLNLDEEWEQPLLNNLKIVVGKLKEAQGLHGTASSKCTALAEKLTAAGKDAGVTVAGAAD